MRPYVKLTNLLGSNVELQTQLCHKRLSCSKGEIYLQVARYLKVMHTSFYFLAQSHGHGLLYA